MNYLRLIEFPTGNLLQNKCNAIFWSVVLNRNITNAEINCSLIYVTEDGGTKDLGEHFSMFIPDSVLQNWGADDSVIDDFVCTYSSLFVKDTGYNKNNG